MNLKELIEYFHLMFVHRLSSKVDRKFFCLKGGCNLRFFFQSIRYSEDIDFDVRTTSVETLRKNVNKILEDKAFHSILMHHQNLKILDWSDPKQTDTTQRWKVKIQTADQLPVPTKIEFSRRNQSLKGAEVAQINLQLTSSYKLQPIILQHYNLSQALYQKMEALINRTETQARDIIDLKILIDKSIGTANFFMTQTKKEKAIDTLKSVSFEDYKSQAWPYLLSSYQEYYGKKGTWQQIQSEITKFIENLQEQST